MLKLSSSPEHSTFQRTKYLERQAEKGLMDDPKTIDDLFKSFEQLRREQEQDPEWQKNNLEWDLRTTDWILKKVRESDTYAQNLYAALCNNDFVKNDIWPLLKGEDWGCSWRYAGGIIADMREEGDYMDWYCSGMGQYEGSVGEGIVTEEVKDDLLKLGWLIEEYENGS